MSSYYNKLFQRTDDGLVIIKIESDEKNSCIYPSILEVNVAFKNIIGKSNNELIGENIIDIWPHMKEEWKDFFLGIDKENRFNNTISYVEIGNKYFLIKGVYLEDKIIGISFIDITETIHFKGSLEKESSKLEQVTKKLEVTKQKLIEKDKMASIGQLAAGIAHEINNPLGFVLSNFDTLKKYMDKFKKTILDYREFKHLILQSKDIDCCDYKTLVNKIEDEKGLDFILEDLNELFTDTNDGLERVRKIVLAMRTFSRQDQDGVFEQYDLNLGIETSLLIAKNEIKYTATVETDLGEIPFIEANSGQINQVFLNLVVNASHAIKEKKFDKLGLIKIKTYCDDTYVYCSIEDNGIGISEENVQNVFKPFFTTKPSGIGTGLGLSISSDIIKNKHHGDIFLESQLNEYTVLTFRLPIKQQPLGEKNYGKNSFVRR